VAVYGTLKFGFHNWNYFLKGKLPKYFGITTLKGLLYDVGFPYFVPEDFVEQMELKKLVKPIQVEVYEVDRETFEELDYLEGYPHHYDRKVIKIQTFKVIFNKNDLKVIRGNPINAWIYYIDHIPEYAELLNGNPDYETTLSLCADKICRSKEIIFYTFWKKDTFKLALESIKNNRKGKN
jgi:gamma-glutamylcyclotransferase (GGCT)/AIG2-like uncharacterized protein YtfP